MAKKLHHSIKHLNAENLNGEQVDIINKMVDNLYYKGTKLKKMTTNTTKKKLELAYNAGKKESEINSEIKLLEFAGTKNLPETSTFENWYLGFSITQPDNFSKSKKETAKDFLEWVIDNYEILSVDRFRNPQTYQESNTDELYKIFIKEQNN